MKAIREPAALHHSARELVHDDDLALLDHVFLVSNKQRLRLEGIFQLMDDAEIILSVQVGDIEQLLQLCDAIIGQRDTLVLFVYGVIDVHIQARNYAREPLVLPGRHIRRAADNQRGPRLVDQDVVDLVNNGVGERSLNPTFNRRRHIVAQVVEPELIVGAVGNVGCISVGPSAGAHMLEPALSTVVRQIVKLSRVMLQCGDRDSETFKHFPHPMGVTPSQIIVHCHQMNALARKRVQVGRQRRHQRLALARPHLRDLAFVQHHAAHQLNIIMPLAQRAHRRLSCCGKRLWEQIVQVFALGDPSFELDGHSAQFVIAKPLKFRL